MTTIPTVSPMMAQFFEIKSQHPDALLFYRMGDFYELFFDDAVVAAAALGIALTKRGQHLGQDIAMCGVPAHSSEGYLLKLIRKGHRVAVCEQMENPAEAKKRGAKSVVRREVTRLVTAGTLTEDTLLDVRQHNYLAAYAEVRGDAAVAWVDVSTGEVTVAGCTPESLAAMLARLTPREMLVSDALTSTLRDVVAEAGASLTPLAQASFDSSAAEERLARAYNVASLDAFGTFTRAETGALGALVDYLELTQRGRLPLLRPPVRERSGVLMQIDAATRRNLELTRNLSGGREETLLSVVDRTVTGPGARLLETQLNAPSTEVGIIQERLDAVQHLGDAADLLRMIRDLLRRVPDFERSLSRLALERGGPRDIAAIREALRQAGHLADALGPVLPALLADARAPLEGHEELVELLDAALVAEPPNLARDGGFVAPRYLAELDEARQLRDEGKGIIGMLQSEYARNTGIGSLKIRHNNVLGFFVEVSSIQGPKLLDPQISHTFVHRQTTANAVRFTTLALSEIETKMLNAGQRALEMEMRIFEKLRSAIIQRAGAVAAAAHALAAIDVAAGFAELARVEGWTRPYVDEGTSLSIAGGRHPVVERALRQRGGNFIANDCNLGSQAPDARRLWLLTGPNMGGKSTFLRQNALIALIAQTGSFVPATSVHLGVVDQLFSRVGAADDLARGRSTFMVEMVETAAILNQAGPRALVILDEVGRGTATYDGLSIAWATLEHLHDVNRCRTLFATHYHELTALSARLPGLRNATLAVREWHSDVIFLHEVREGVADRSYGVQVARLAGLPASVVGRAREVLKALEEGERNSGGKGTAVDDLPLFSQHAAVRETTPSEIEQRLLDTMPDDLSPRDALALIYELRAAVSN